MAMSKYLLASFFGAIIGACCVLIAVYVTNTKALVISPHDMPEVVNSLHTRINDFYIFAGIVTTLLLAINVGVFIRAEDEVEKHIKQNFGDIERNIKAMQDRCKQIQDDMESLHKKSRTLNSRK